MPRANRYWVPGAAYHLTHRCHNRSFLLQRAVDRSAYRKFLREKLLSSPVSLLSYTITCNHIHLLVTGETAEPIASLMQNVQGQFGEAYNRRKQREGAFWSDRYHATMIDDSDHLIACLRYIDLNMVRAGVVRHPRDWPWTAWHELVGERQRYRLINREALLARLEGMTWPEFSEHYRQIVDEAREKDAIQRDAQWTETLAVGSADFARRIEAQLDLEQKRTRMTLEETEPGRWILRESSLCTPPYTGKSTPRNQV